MATNPAPFGSTVLGQMLVDDAEKALEAFGTAFMTGSATFAPDQLASPISETFSVAGKTFTLSSQPAIPSVEIKVS